MAIGIQPGSTTETPSIATQGQDKPRGVATRAPERAREAVLLQVLDTGGVVNLRQNIGEVLVGPRRRVRADVHDLLGIAWLTRLSLMPRVMVADLLDDEIDRR